MKVVLAAAVVFRLSFGVVTMEAVTFEDMKQDNLEGNTLSLATCWEAIGIDPQDRLYVVYGDNNKGSPREDCSVFMYDSRTGERKALGTLRKQANEDGTLWENEPLPKGHTPVVYLNGKMYFGTQNFHEAYETQSLENLKNEYHGSHIFSIDCETLELRDEARYMPEKCFQRGQGLIALAPMPWNNCIIGFSHPMGDVLVYNPEEKKLDINYHDPDNQGRVGRIIVPTSLNKVYIFQTSRKLGIYSFDTNQRTFTEQGLSYHFMNGRAISKDGKKAYVCDYQARLWRIDMEKDELVKIGGFGGWSNNNVRCYGLTFSLDEKKVYGITTTSELYEYDEETGDITKLLDKSTIGAGGFSGYNCTDSKGNIYFARHKFTHPNPCGILKFDVSDRSGPSPYPSVCARKARRDALSQVNSTIRKGRSIVHALPYGCAWEVRVYSMRGEQVAMENGVGMSAAFSTEQLAKGFYFVQIRADGERVTQIAPIAR
jgi:hypothetical protein